MPYTRTYILTIQRAAANSKISNQFLDICCLYCTSIGPLYMIPREFLEGHSQVMAGVTLSVAVSMVSSVV